jgi:pimeloyl-ACP methyl ester carboxylesterase
MSEVSYSKIPKRAKKILKASFILLEELIQ